MKIVGVIILNWNGADDTIHCVESLGNIKSCKLKIIVIDNGSSVEDVNKLKKVKNISIIHNRNNLGYAKGINQGVKYFLGMKEQPDYILQMNNDSFGESDFLKEMLEVFEQDPMVGSVGPLIYSAHKKSHALGTGGVIHLKSGTISYDYVEFYNIKVSKSPYMVDWVGGTVELIRIELFREIGLLSDKYGSYVEDVEYSLRIRGAGYKVVICPQSKIFHGVSKSSGGQFSLLKRYLISRNAVYLSKEYFGYRFAFLNFMSQIRSCLHYPKKDIVTALFVTLLGFIIGCFS